MGYCLMITDTPWVIQTNILILIVFITDCLVISSSLLFLLHSMGYGLFDFLLITLHD